MRKLFLVGLLATATAALAVGGIGLQQSTTFTFTDCAAAGSSSQTLTGPAEYLLTVTQADTAICYAASCASPGGTTFPMNTVILLAVGNAGQVVSCRSSLSNGDAQFTKAN